MLMHFILDIGTLSEGRQAATEGDALVDTMQSVSRIASAYIGCPSAS